jgi:hypothetical protein
MNPCRFGSQLMKIAIGKYYNIRLFGHFKKILNNQFKSFRLENDLQVLQVDILAKKINFQT